jgi:hypothetical protein
VDIARKGQGWHERAPTDRELSSEETDAANALVSSLMKGQGTNPTTNPSSDPSRDGASFEALARVRVGRGEGKGDEIVELGRPSREGTKVRRLADGATLDVSAALAHRLLPSEIVFRGRQIFPSVLQGKAATALETECEGNAQVLTRGDIGWSYDKPSGFRSDSAIVAELVANLVRTQAESWAADADDGSFGFGDSSTRCSIIVTFDQDGGPHKTGIVFGREAEGGGFYAHVLGEEPVFLAAKSLHDDAGRLLLDRSAFHVDSGDVATLTLSRGKEKLVLLGHDRKLRLADGGGPELGDKLAALLDAMHADSVVHLGPPRPNEGFSRPSLDVRIQTRSDAGLKDVRFVVGDSTMIWKERMFFARLDGVDATFALARDRVSELLNAL